MRTAKIQTTSALGPASKPLRYTLKEQEVQQLTEHVEDLETSITVHLTLMQDISSPKPSGEDTDSIGHFPVRILERLQEQRRKLEAAIALVRTQKDLCIEKAQRCEREAELSLRSEQEQDKELHRCLERLTHIVEDKQSTITTLEVRVIEQEKEAQGLSSCQKVQVDLNGLALRVTRLTRSVRQDEKTVAAEKCELLHRCEVSNRQELEGQLRQERLRFPKESRVRKAAKTAEENYGLVLTYENYLLCGRGPHANSMSVAISDTLDPLEEAREDEFRKMHFKSKSEMNVSQYIPDLPAPQKADEMSTQAEGLFLAVRMKNEEMASLHRLSGYFDSQKALLMHKINQVKAKVSAAASDRLSQDASNPEEEGLSM